MSCGLGAVILVFMLVKHHVGDAPVSTDFLRNEIQALQAEARALEETLRGRIAQAQAGDQKKSSARNEIAALERKVADKRTALEKLRRDLEALKKTIEKTTVKQPQDIIEIDGQGEETYLLGLKVEGKKIAILVDASASMTAEKLIDVIKIKHGNRQEKLTADKWRRTKRIVKWLLARLPQESEVAVIAFNHAVHFPGGENWLSANHRPSIQTILADLETLIPDGATNLQKGLIAVKQRQATDVYVITDGLPTTGESRYRSLNPFSGCSSLRGNAKTISGACRVTLFQQTVKETTLNDAVVNVVLLPIEGDPDAVNQYWGWASKTGGLVISPAANWP